jgi:hypothetical protein
MLLTKYFSGDQIKKSEMGRHVASVKPRIGACKGLAREPRRKIPLDRARRRWECNVKTDLKEFVWSVWTALIWMFENSTYMISSTCKRTVLSIL